jgi:hypothetical protein
MIIKKKKKETIKLKLFKTYYQRTLKLIKN